MKILAVEDDPVSQRVMAKYLEPLGSVTVMENGLKGLESFKEAVLAGESYALVCLDIMMPEMSGQHTLKAIREFEEERGIQFGSGAKIVMTTGLNDAENVVGAFSSGCEAYVTKPVDKAALMGELRKLGISTP